MKVKIKPKIKFLTHEYKVLFDTKECRSCGSSGVTEHLYQKIYLDGEATPPSELIQILVHEYIHVIERHTGMKLDDMDIERISEGMCVLFESWELEFDWSEIKEEK